MSGQQKLEDFDWQSGNSMNIIYIEVETQYSLQWAGEDMKSFFLHLCISF